MKVKWSVLLCIMFLYSSCTDSQTPKERGFYRITFPVKEYKNIKIDELYSCEIPVYSNIKREENKETEWHNVFFPKQNGQLHLTYFSLNDNLAEHIEDTHKFVYKHTIKADAIKSKDYRDIARKVYGTLYDIEGNTASSVQFFVTDSTKHFLRGSLYLNEKPNKDSLKVVIDFLRQDVIHLMKTIEWK